MLNFNILLIRPFINELKEQYQITFGILEPEFENILVWAGNSILEIISGTDALYHNVEHTMLVTLAGQEIIRGKHLKEGGITPQDWLNFIISLLCHDVGYVRGILKNDKKGCYDSGVKNKLITLEKGSTDAALTAYHVDRSKQFVFDRFEKVKYLDVDTIASYIEMTRFPIPADAAHSDTKSLEGLTRAADFIGQLGDPNYLRKTPALFYEMQEAKNNSSVTYLNPYDLKISYAKFYWDVVSPYIKDALVYLNLTPEGKQWIAQLHSQVFDAEHQRL
ncbi:MAG: metal-dependent phosphohydrolase [bacterium]